MAARQLSRPVLLQQLLAAKHGGAAAPAAQQLFGAAAGGGAGAAAEQAAGRAQPFFQQLLRGMRRDAQRAYNTLGGGGPQQQLPQQQAFFQPSRLYPKQRSGSEAAAFWGLVGVNAAVAFAAKADGPEMKQAVSRHFRASVEAVADGRLHTLLTSAVCHTSVWHAGINLLMLLLYRRTQPLAATELLVLYVLGSIVGSATHVAYCWYDAGGPEYGLKYALNTPGLYGCSGAVAAIAAYKATLQPLGMPALGVPLPVPVAAATLLYCCLYLREADYADYTGKFGAAAFGVLAALVAVGSGKRRFVWAG